MRERSRSDDSAMFRVRGIGVAVRVRTSTSARRALSRSFWRTPKRCSSSTITRPRRRNATSSWRRRWVPMTMSVAPWRSPRVIASRCARERKRESCSMRTGHSAKRSVNVWKCCCARRVVGTRIATCQPSIAAANAARIATSVFPNPTSPHTSRSIGRSLRRSPRVASMAAAWSAVSSNGKPSANAAYWPSSNAMTLPERAARRARISRSSAATSRTRSAAALRAFCHCWLPSLCRGGFSAPA